MVSQSRRQSNDCQRRVDVAGGRKHRATGNKEIMRTEHTALRIDHTVLGVIRHASRAHQMPPGWFKLLSDICLNVITMKLKITNFTATKMPIEKLVGLYNARDVAFVVMEVHHNSPHPTWIQVISQDHAAITIRRQFRLVP